MRQIIFLVIGLVLSSPSWAQESKRESVEELLISADMDSMMDSIYAQMDQMFLGMGEQLGIQPYEQEAFENYMLKVSALMQEEMSWKEMREPMIDIYLTHFSENEIQDMLSFYRSETGKSMIEKTPLVMADAMTLSQDMLADFMPKLQVLVEEFQEELQSQRNSKRNVKQ